MVSAEVMDRFGVLAFLILLVIGISLLKVARKRAILVIIISLIGLVVDVTIVIRSFLN